MSSCYSHAQLSKPRTKSRISWNSLLVSLVIVSSSCLNSKPLVYRQSSSIFHDRAELPPSVVAASGFTVGRRSECRFQAPVCWQGHVIRLAARQVIENRKRDFKLRSWFRTVLFPDTGSRRATFTLFVNFFVPETICGPFYPHGFTDPKTCYDFLPIQTITQCQQTSSAKYFCTYVFSMYKYLEPLEICQLVVFFWSNVCLNQLWRKAIIKFLGCFFCFLDFAIKIQFFFPLLLHKLGSIHQNDRVAPRLHAPRSPDKNNKHKFVVARSITARVCVGLRGCLHSWVNTVAPWHPWSSDKRLSALSSARSCVYEHRFEEKSPFRDTVFWCRIHLACIACIDVSWCRRSHQNDKNVCFFIRFLLLFPWSLCAAFVKTTLKQVIFVNWSFFSPPRHHTTFSFWSRSLPLHS